MGERPPTGRIATPVAAGTSSSGLSCVTFGVPRNGCGTEPHPASAGKTNTATTNRIIKDAGEIFIWHAHPFRDQGESAIADNWRP